MRQAVEMIFKVYHGENGMKPESLREKNFGQLRRQSTQYATVLCASFLMFYSSTQLYYFLMFYREIVKP